MVHKLLLVGAIILTTGLAAHAATALNEKQMDNVTAGDATATAFGQFTSVFTSFTQSNGQWMAISQSSSSSSSP